MKIALITDTHWGVRGDSIAFLDNSKKFFDDIFFPYLKQNDISDVVHLGDLVDRRKYINIYTAKRLREDFLEPLANNSLNVHFIAGNHDTYFKNTNKTNSLRELVDKYNMSDKWFIYDNTPSEVEFDNDKILFIPWICDDNREITMKMIDETKCQIVMGHLEIAGFEMYKGSMVSHGDDRSVFSKFDMVMSGHYHHRSSDGSIFYLGSHAEFTWSDYDDPKGFHIFDTKTRELKFIKNPYNIFKKIWYNDTKEDFDITKLDFSEYSNTMVKVIVQEKINSYWFDKFIETLEKNNPIEIQIVQDNLNLNLEEEQDIVSEAESTIDIFKKYINNQKDKQKSINTEKLEKVIVDLYHEALTL